MPGKKPTRSFARGSKRKIEKLKQTDHVCAQIDSICWTCNVSHKISLFNFRQIFDSHSNHDRNHSQVEIKERSNAQFSYEETIVSKEVSFHSVV